MNHRANGAALLRSCVLLAMAVLLPACGAGAGGTLTPTVAPAVPAALKAAPGNQSVTLSWTPSAAGSSYAVLRSSAPAGPFLPITDPAAFLGETVYVDRGLSNGTPCYYAVKARNSFGESGLSEVAGVTPGFKATAIAAGGGTATALLLDGTVWTWGQTWLGQGEATGVADPTDVPAQVPLLRGVSSASTGAVSSVALLGDGTVWTWGQSLSATPSRVPNLTDVVAVSAGGYRTEKTVGGDQVFLLFLPFALALRSDGTVWAWGDNSKGQLGNGTVTAVGDPLTSDPAQVHGLPKMVAVSAGGTCCLALAENGTVWAWGNNASGQSGSGSTVPAATVTPAPIPNFNRVTAISAGSDSCLALREDGSVWAWGANASGQLGIGSSGATPVSVPTPVLLPAGVTAKAISAGATHGLAVDSNGAVWGWGDDGSGALGDGQSPSAPVVRPVQAQNISGAVAVAAGQGVSLALLIDGTVCAWGDNRSGQVGAGTGSLHTTPVEVNNLTDASAVAAGDTFGAALRTDGTIWTWGGNTSGELGAGSVGPTPRVLPAKIPSLSGFAALSAGGRTGLGLRSDGTVWVWGSNSVGQFGNGVVGGGPGPSQVPGLTGITGISGGNTCLAVKSDGTVWGWGYNYSGQTGNGSTATSPVTKPVRIQSLTSVVAAAAGGAFSLALRSDGTVWAWGDNSAGELGIGSNASGPFTTPVQIPGLGGVVAIAAGYSTGYALKGDGTVWGWGEDHGLLGSSSFESFSSRSPIPIPGLQGIRALSTGWQFSLAASDDGTVWAWGSDNTAGQLGNGSTSQGSIASPPARVEGLAGATRIAAGGGFALALRGDGQVWGWGNNSSDQLGVAYVDHYSIPVVISR